MNVGHANDGGFSERSDSPKLTVLVSSASLPPERLVQLWELTGRHPSQFLEECVAEDVKSKKHLQAYAVGEVPSFAHELTGDGPQTVNKLVGWMRARIGDAVEGFPRFATIEEVYVDPTFERGAVEEFLMRRLQGRVLNARREIAGLVAEIPADDIGRSARYMRAGFVDESWPSDTLTWRKPAE